MLANNLFTYWTYRVFAPGAVLRATYDSFQKLLEYDGKAHEEMAELEALYYQDKKEDFVNIRRRYEKFSVDVLGMVECLRSMSPGSYVTLKSYYKKFHFYSTFLLAPPSLDVSPPFTCSSCACEASEELVGGKAAQLAALHREFNFPVPKGFVITANSFNYFFASNDLRKSVDDVLATIQTDNPKSLIQVSARLTELLMNAEIPSEIVVAVEDAWNDFSNGFDSPPLTAVRSSSVNEDGSCSFAGQYTTVLDVAGNDILDAWRRVICSKYSPEALAYRIHTGLGDEETAMAALVLEMLDARVSGVLYTGDPAGSMEDQVSVHVVKGQGDALVSGQVISESLLLSGDTPKSELLTVSEISLLKKQAEKIAAYYLTPRDVEWSITTAGRLVYLQCRPLGIQEKQENTLTDYPVPDRGSLVFRAGVTAASGQAAGRAYKVDADHLLENVPPGAILILRDTAPAAVRVLKGIQGVVAELGSVAGHFATVCREFGIPLLLAVGDRIEEIHQGQELTLFADTKELWQGSCLPQFKEKPQYERQKALPYYRRLHGLLGFVTPLNLLDPDSKKFVPESCRSLHDIIRFCHEMAVRTMFSLGDRGSGRVKGKRKLRSDLPLDVFLLDVGDGLEVQDQSNETVAIEEVCCEPFLAIWQGLNHPSVVWSDQSHFDWKSFDEIAMAGGIASKNASEFASFAVLSSEYVNLNMRFGYHFTLVDTMCGEDSAKNYCQFRFAGGGGDFSGKSLRLHFVETILKANHFQVRLKGDLLDAGVQHLEKEQMLKVLRMIGRLLGVTKLMDMRLKDEIMVEEQIQTFLDDRKLK